MTDSVVLLCALIPPGSVESAVGALQAGLFSEHGWVSSLAFPPLVPIAFLDHQRLPRTLLPDLNLAIPRGWRARMQGTEWVGGCLYARIDTGGAWTALRARAQEQCGSPSGGFLPVAEGFCMGCVEAPAARRPRIRPLTPELSFSSAALALVRFDPRPPQPDWWRDLHWEIQEERPLRGRTLS